MAIDWFDLSLGTSVGNSSFGLVPDYFDSFYSALDLSCFHLAGWRRVSWLWELGITYASAAATNRTGSRPYLHGSRHCAGGGWRRWSSSVSCGFFPVDNTSTRLGRGMVGQLHDNPEMRSVELRMLLEEIGCGWS